MLMLLALPYNDGAQGEESDEPAFVVFNTPGGSFRVPKVYLVSQFVSDDGKLGMSNRTFAFQFQMPDGQPVSHDYGLAGLPLVPADAEIYPVVVNDLSFDQKEIARNPPEMQMARMIRAYSLGGANVDRIGDTVRIRPIVHPTAYDYEYYRTISPTTVFTAGGSAMIRCSQPDTDDNGPSSCDGSLLVPALQMMMHIRFPKHKIGSLDTICVAIINMISILKHN